MKRKVILLALVIAFLIGFGAVLHSPSSMIDIVTGATPKSKKVSQKSVELEGNYILGINPITGQLSKDLLHENIKNAVLGKSNFMSIDKNIKVILYISKTDTALLKYMKVFSKRLEEIDINVKVKKLSDTMLRSRVVSGNYEMFLASEDVINVKSLEQENYIILNSKEMR